MIPKIIHYCWFGGKPLPESAINCIESWKKYCPDYEIIKWDETNSDLFFNDYVKEAYENKKWAFVSDVIRLKVIYEMGGLYFDTDVEVIRNFDELLKYNGFFCFEGKKFINTGLGFGGIKSNQLVKKMLDSYIGKHFILGEEQYDLLPCPHRNTEILKMCGLKTNGKMQNIQNNLFLPEEYLCPYNYETGVLNITSNTFSIHHYDESWRSESERQANIISGNYIRKYGKIIGKFIYCIKFLGIKEVLRILKLKISKYK